MGKNTSTLKQIKDEKKVWGEDKKEIDNKAEEDSPATLLFEDGGGKFASGLNKNWKKVEVNNDLSKRVVVHTERMKWDPSPEYPAIGRKFLDRNGAGTFTPNTTIVSFGAGVSDAYHTHPHGEEFYVMSGVFSDHTGDYLPGFYVRHPIDFCHAPFIRRVNADNTRAEPAVLWVKVSQQVHRGEKIIVKDTRDPNEQWMVVKGTKSGSIKKCTLFEDQDEHVQRQDWGPMTEITIRQPRDGEEIFVIDGDLQDRMWDEKNGKWTPFETYERRSWIRNPTEMEGTKWNRISKGGCSIIYKFGHLENVKTVWGQEISSDVTVLPQVKRNHGDLHYVDTKRVNQLKLEGNYNPVPEDEIFSQPPPKQGDGMVVHSKKQDQKNRRHSVGGGYSNETDDADLRVPHGPNAKGQNEKWKHARKESQEFMETLKKQIKEFPVFLVADMHGANASSSRMIQEALSSNGVKDEDLHIFFADQDPSGYDVMLKCTALTGYDQPPVLFIEGHCEGDQKVVMKKFINKSIQEKLIRLEIITEEDVKKAENDSLYQNMWNYPKGFANGGNDIKPNGKFHVLIGCCGSSASDKVPHLVKACVEAGFDTKLCPTTAGERFFDYGGKDMANLLDEEDIYRDADEINFHYDHLGMDVKACHLALASWADVFVIAPATCNTMGTIAGGTAPNLITNIALAWQYGKKPFIVCPACNSDMWDNPAVKANVAKLKSMGIMVSGPIEGKLSNGDTGLGCMTLIPDIYKLIVDEKLKWEEAGGGIVSSVDQKEEGSKYEKRNSESSDKISLVRLGQVEE